MKNNLAITGTIYKIAKNQEIGWAETAIWSRNNS
jgi:hypothetical protein